MATDRALPSRLSDLNRRGAPWAAVAVCAVAAAAFAASGSLTVIAGVTDAAVYLVFLAVNGSIIVLRFRAPAAERPFRVPFAVGRVPVTAVLAIAAALVMLTQLEWRSLALGGAVIVTGMLLAAVRPPAGDSAGSP
jgi:APA family basic amino acid/polyamine antiporter